MTLSAQVLTLPLVAWHFEQVSLISLIVNLLVTPILPLIMILGGFATLLGLAFVGCWGAWLPLRYVVNTVELLARVPFASVPIRISVYSLGLTYALIGLATWYRAQIAPTVIIVHQTADSKTLTGVASSISQACSKVLRGLMMEPQNTHVSNFLSILS